MTDPLQQAALGLVAGVVFGLFGYFTKAERGEQINVRKLMRTAVVYGAAGLVVGFGGDPITQENVATATGFTVVLGEVFDKLWARAVRDTDIDW